MGSSVLRKCLITLFGPSLLQKDGETFQELTPVPVAAEEYCVAGIDSDRIFVTSLGDYKDDSYMFNRGSIQ